MLQASLAPAAAGATFSCIHNNPKPVTLYHLPSPPVSPLPLQPVTVVLVAFGFKLGVPDYIDFIFDVRSVPNPWKLNDFKVRDANRMVEKFGRGLTFMKGVI